MASLRFSLYAFGFSLTETGSSSLLELLETIGNSANGVVVVFGFFTDYNTPIGVIGLHIFIRNYTNCFPPKQEQNKQILSHPVSTHRKFALIQLKEGEEHFCYW